MSEEQEHRTPSMRARESGSMVLHALRSVAPAGIRTRKELSEITGLTPSQVSRGLVWVREVAADRDTAPFSYSRRDGYKQSDDLDDWITFGLAEFGLVGTKMFRLESGTLRPARRRAPDDVLVKFLYQQAGAMVSASSLAKRELEARMGGGPRVEAPSSG